MAKSKSVKQSEYDGKVTIITTPSWLGSHASMVDADLTEKLGQPDLVVCKDDIGLYITKRKHLDNRMADVYRHDSQFRSDNWSKYVV